MTSHASRKRESEIRVCELIWALEDEVVERRRAKSEPPMKADRAPAPVIPETHAKFDLEAAFEAAMRGSAEVTWTGAAEPSRSSKKATRNKRRKTAKADEAAKKSEITVLTEEEAPSIYMTPPKSPDHEMPFSPTDAKHRLMDAVNEYRSHANNQEAITVVGQFAQMAYCYNNKARPGEIGGYDYMQVLVQFYTHAPQIQDPPAAAENPYWFLPQKSYLMRRQTRERLYAAVSFLRAGQYSCRPSLPEQYRGNAMMEAIFEEATAMSRNCHTLAMLLEDLHSIPDL